MRPGHLHSSGCPPRCAASHSALAVSTPGQIDASLQMQIVQVCHEPHLVGRWTEIDVDPSVWGFGSQINVLQYTVKGAAARLVQWQCIHMRGWVPGIGLIPRLWRDEAGQLNRQQGLQQLEVGQKRT